MSEVVTVVMTVVVEEYLTIFDSYVGSRRSDVVVDVVMQST